MKVVPLQAVPSQQLTIGLNGQNCSINVYQKTTGLYFDLYLDNAPISIGVRCLNCARLLEDRQYAGFIGDFMFVDTQSPTGVLAGTDPTYTGLGSQYELWFLEVPDFANLPV